jgi:maltose/moltooligosaccharide transporter
MADISSQRRPLKFPAAQAAEPIMQKPKLSFWQIWNMSFGFLGIQFGWGLQMANMSAIYGKLGAEPSKIPILWLAGPITGLVVQPIIGAMSDRTWTRLGRRRPFILGGAILASLALVLMPNCPSVWMAAGLLWVLDGTINASMQPFRALVADNMPDEQNSLGFAIQSLFIGLAALLTLPVVSFKNPRTEPVRTGGGGH